MLPWRRLEINNRLLIQLRKQIYFQNSYKMILSRATNSGRTAAADDSMKVPNSGTTFEEFILKRDYNGAKTILEFSDKNDDEKELWVAFCRFHLGDYRKALDDYLRIKSTGIVPEKEDLVELNLAVCMFYLGMYEESEEMLRNIADSPLKTRLTFHLMHKLNNEERLLELHGSLQDAIEDQLSLAGMHYLRSHYQEAIDIYKRILLDNKDLLALNVYVALCYYKLDYYDISQEVLDLYLTKFADSTIAINLRACNRFRLFNGRVAEQDIRNMIDSGTFGAELLKHNAVVFSGGEGALNILPQLIDIIPEARLNLAIFHMKRGEAQEAFQLMKNIEPTIPTAYILKGVIYATLGQKTRSKEYLKNAQQCLQVVGGSASECDTIPGRQAMASAFFLYNQFEEVLVYLNSIRSYFVSDDVFNYNYAQAKTATGYYKEAEELFMQITDSSIRGELTYAMSLARCHIHNDNAELAWQLFVGKDTNPDAFQVLQLIANDCYKLGDFWVSAKAFDMLEKLDPNPEYWEGKRGACAGALQAIVANRARGKPPNGISDIIGLLRDSPNGQAEILLKTIRRFANSMK